MNFVEDVNIIEDDVQSINDKCDKINCNLGMLMRFWNSVLGFCVTRALYQSDHSGRAGHQWKKTKLKLFSFDLNQLANLARRVHA